MQPFQLDATVTSDGTLVLSGLPFRAGQTVHVSIEQKPALTANDNPYPLRGLPVEYIDPFEPAVPPEDWDALNDRD